jgi:Mrp family chromosome partitioning ATPase
MNDTSLISSESSSLRPGYSPYPEHAHHGEATHPMRMLHLFLRGRYILLVVLVAILTPAGAWFAYRFGRTEFTSIGQILVAPVRPYVIHPTEETSQIQMFEQYMDAQATTMHSQRTIDLAMQNPDWKKWRWPLPDKFNATLALELTVTHQGEILTIRVDDADPTAAMYGTQTVIAAYQELSQEQMIDQDKVRDDALDKVINSLEADRLRYQLQISDLAKNNPYATDDLSKAYDATLANVAMIQQAINARQMAILGGGTGATMGGIPSTTDPAAPQGETLLRAIAQSDTRMARALEDRDHYTESLREDDDAGLLDQNETVKIHRGHLAAANSDIEKSLDVYKERVAAMTPTTRPVDQVAGAGATTQPATDAVAEMQAKLDFWKNELTKVGMAQRSFEDLKYNLAETETKLAEANTRRDQLQIESPMSGRLSVIGNGNLPSEPSKDTHIAMGALGGFGGFSMGILVVVLLGLRDRRFHGPEDTQFTGTRCPMLGMLPTLSSDLSNSEQAAMAAHFVHGIRAMLQIKGTGADTGRVLAITSPSAHNGKTSLSLALGVSFAGAHSRTLVIDCDFVGRALSERSNAVARPRLGRILRKAGIIDEQQLQEGLDKAVQHGQRLGESLVTMGYMTQEKLDQTLAAQKEHTFGVLEAIDGEDLAECVAPTGINGLSILPLGQACAEHIGSLSPAMLQQVLDNCRRQYDVIIVDTGPILGSLEAAMVATQADDVVLVLSNGENRTTAERSLRYLEMVGAKVAGFVFNRATPRDFLHSDGSQRVSTSADKFRSSKTWTKNDLLAHFGPVAQAVARTVTAGGSTTANGNGRVNGAGNGAGNGSANETTNSSGNSNGNGNGHAAS